MDNYNIIDVKSQSILEKLAERIKYKERILPYLEEVYTSDTSMTIADRIEQKVENLKNCAKEIMLHDETGQITGAKFCKHRLCPVCNYRRSTMLWHKVKEVIKDLDTDFLLITLTVRNCEGCRLKETIDHILQSFHRITSRRKWRKCFHGFIRGLEITYNYEKNTFHPHIHILVSTSPEYFKEEYLDIQTLREWWVQSAKLDYYVQVDIRKVKDKDNAIAEVVKYAVKIADILEQEQDEQRLQATKTLSQAIANRRLMSTGGNIKKLAKIKKINLEDDVLDEVYEKRKNSKYFVYKDGKYVEENF
ncbi:MAG: protein rep [Peptococcaceae bacterium]|nr:protein rep [Peptococcaceae bacterium]